ncbi:MAG: MMPL family transporter [Alphaproteobacteria bacterium]|nr:MMPL family transporter [Alphaproteobacteria bacterium]
MSGQEGRYARYARWVLRHRTAVWIACLVLAVASAVIGLPPKIDSNLLNLLPDSDPTVAALHRINEEEGGLNLLTLTYRSDDPAALDAYLDDLAARFEAMPEVAFAVHELDPDLAKQVGLLQLDPDELATLNGRLEGAYKLGTAARNPMLIQPLMDMGPLTDKIARSADNALFRASADGTGRLIVRPTTTSADPLFARAFMDEVEALLDAADAPSHGVELVWMGGAYRHNVEDVEGIRHDLVTTTVWSGLLVLLIMVASFRSLRSLLIVFPPLIVANLVNFAFVRLAVGPLNTFTSFSSAILFGLGIDFAIHLVGRYREFRSDGASTEDAIAWAWEHTGPPCTTAALTSAAGFMALSFAEFVGFAQLGWLLAFGLLVCLLAMLTMLPLLLYALDHQTTPLLGATPHAAESRSTYALAPPGVGLMAVVTIAIAVFALPRIAYEYDLSALRRDGLSYEELSDQERQLARESYSPVVVFYDGEPEQVQPDQERLNELIHAGGMPHVAAAVSIANVLPNDQAERNLQIERLVQIAEDERLRNLPESLARKLLPLRGLEVRQLTRADLPEAVLLLLGANNPDAPRMLLLPKGNMWDVRESEKLREEIGRALPGRAVTGEYLGIASMFLMAFRDAPRVGGIALLLVALLAWWDLRKPLFVVGAIGTLVAGMIWAGGAMWLLGIKLTMVNLTGIPILLGIGVDVVIHLLHRLEEEGPGGIRRAMSTTGVAASLSTLTTLCAFGSLMFADARSVRSLGSLVVVGLLVVFLVSGFLLPLIWSAGWKLSGRAPADAPVPEDAT